MINNVWTISGFLVTLVTASFAAFVIKGNGCIEQEKKLPLGWDELCVGIGILIVGLLLRWCFLGNFMGGMFTSDEQLISVIYTSAIAHLEPARNGATHIGYAIALNWWYGLFGFSALTARCFSATLGTVGLASFGILLFKTLGSRPALWGTAFASISLFGIYFSKLALETGWVLFFPPCIGLLLVFAKERRNPAFGIVAGALFSFSLFSYPGIILSTLILSASICLVITYRYIKTPEISSFAHNKKLLVLAGSFLFGFLPFFFFSLNAHQKIFGLNSQLLFRGGGGTEWDLSKIIEGLLQVFRDSFVTADSWYMRYRGMPFFELGLIPIAFLGWLRLKSAVRPAWMVGAVVTLPLLMLSVPFTGAYPGMRRALFVLLPYYALAGLGFSCILEWMAQAKIVPFWKSRKFLSLSLILIVSVNSISYQLTKGLSSTSWNFSPGFFHDIIPLDFLQNALDKNNVVLLESEFSGGQFDLLIYEHYPRLVALYNTHRPIGSLKIIKNTAAQPKLDALRPSIYMTWSAKNLVELAELRLVCIPESSLTSEDIKTPYSAYFIQPEFPRNSCISLADTNSRVGEKINFAFGKLERLRHVLLCEGDGCGADRKNFIYSRGGVVSFLLSKPTSSIKQTLRINVLNPDPNRHSTVEVNGVVVGDLVTKVLQNDIADFTIPPSAERPTENWVIRILPSKDPNCLGWDIVSAELIAGL